MVFFKSGFLARLEIRFVPLPSSVMPITTDALNRKGRQIVDEGSVAYSRDVLGGAACWCFSL
jgi:hypothetical protein